MTRKRALLLPLAALTAAAGGFAPGPASVGPAGGEPAATPQDAGRPPIAQDRIPFPPRRKAETRRYARRHYGLATHRLEDPRVIVQHYTGSRSYRSAYETFARDVPDVELRELPGLCAHFVIDRGGVVHQLVSLRIMCRHTVGLNWTAIGIEHVGVSDADVLGNQRQLRASVRLTRWLADRYSIRTADVIGHSESLSSPYHRERVRSLRRQTHGDFSRATMRSYRRRLARLRASSAARPSRRKLTLGRSLQGRRIDAVAVGERGSRNKALVVGSIHGDESAGIAIARRLRRGPAPAGVDLWVVEDLNPDGTAAFTRQNARGVDLNRNFARGWRRLGRPGDEQYSGPRALSEPETRIARRLIRRLRPRVTIWYHQPLALVDRSGGDVRIQRRYARLSGLPLRRIPPLPGTATRWQNHRFAGSTSFVVELPSGRLGAARARRHASAVLEVVR